MHLDANTLLPQVLEVLKWCLIAFASIRAGRDRPPPNTVVVYQSLPPVAKARSRSRAGSRGR